MQKKDLIEAVGISSSTIAKMGKGEHVSLDVLQRICNFFNCNIGDIVSFEKEERHLKGLFDEEYGFEKSEP